MEYADISLKSLTLVAYGLFFGGLFVYLLPNGNIFFKRIAWKHRLMGFVHLIVLLTGLMNLFTRQINNLLYDVVLGLSGVAVTLTAAKDFESHRHVKNVASGSLDPEATITYDEMLEHSFYQGLNLIQILFLHSFEFQFTSLALRLILVYLATSLWHFRDRFPVNKFSDNYTKDVEYATPITRLLYRLKKYQYVLYKHFLLHGLNITIALTNSAVANLFFFRVYWMSINISYVMEFFLQTLVKKRKMPQHAMLALQRVLMAISTVVALVLIAYYVNPITSLFSLALNFTHRKHEMMNFTVTLVFSVLLYHFLYWPLF